MAIHFRPVIAFFIVLTALALAHADEESGDETLRYFLSKSSLVVSGEIIGEPGGTAGLGRVNYGVSLKVSKVLKGKMPKLDRSALPPELTGLDELNRKQRRPDNVVSVQLYRCELDSGDRLPYLKKGSRAILFLIEKEVAGKKYLRGADPWFSVQPYSGAMEICLERLVNEKKK